MVIITIITEIFRVA